MKKLLILSALALFVACNEPASTANQTASSTQQNDIQLEDFDQFLIKFSKDETFQKSRIKFPLPSSTFDDNNQITETTIPAEDMWNIDLSPDAFKPNNDGMNKVEMTKKLFQDGSKQRYQVHVGGLDNGIATDYFFETEGNQWFLVRFDDFSM